MNYKKRLLIPSIALAITATTTIDFNASEVNTTSETTTIETTDKVYAPLHPTREEVETAAATDLVTIPDANLEQALADKLGVVPGEITVGDMESLTNLMITKKDVIDLTGLEYATSLSTLDLSNNIINDINPVSELTSLTSLHLERNEISDITPVAGLINLTNLDLSNNIIDDITPVAGLRSLTNLRLSNNIIDDITPLSRLKKLRYLFLSNNQINDITPVAGLINLTNLGLSNNIIDDFTPLVGLTNLKNLSLDESKISDITPLAGLTNLTDLSLENNEISDLTPLVGLTNLTSLRLENNEISDLTPLVGLTNLTELILEYNKVSDITPLAGLSNLSKLYLDNNEISEIPPLDGLTNLTVLTVSYNEISKISPLDALSNLTYLTLSNNEITDITPLVGLTNLTRLDLIDNKISDITPLAGLTSLTSLSLAGNQISDISNLSSLVNLTSLALWTQHITLDQITVTDNSELFYTITDIDGIEHQVSLGTPVDGTNDMDGTWSIDTSVGSATGKFQGTVNQTVTYSIPSILTGNDIGNTSEEVSLTDEELIALFEVTNSDGLTITVDQSAVDYSTPGEYTVVFTDEDANELSVTLTITDVLPVLTVDKDSIIIDKDSTIDDVLSQLELSATEITEGDLTDVISYDDSAIDYATAGEYTVVFTVTDEEGNTDTTNVTVTIEKSTLDGNITASASEETVLSDEELIALFEVTNSDDLTITVDQSAVDYSTPGEYTVVFTDEDANELSATLTITDVLPVLTVDKDSITIDKDSTIDDVLSQLELSATEITEGDLTEIISYDDSAVDYTTAGEYTVVFTVADEEGNTDTANVTVTVTSVKSTLDGNTTASTTEETVLTDEELIALFEVTNSDDLSITVDQSAVDYSTPGEYTVVFTDEDANELSATLTITDVLPVLTVDKDSITIGKDSTIDDILSQLELSATEITEGDLTEVISYDDSAVDYTTAGEYTVVFTVADEEGNTDTANVTVTVTSVKSTLDGNTTASTTEETVLTDEELSALFEVTNSDDLTITVDQSAVDYSTPGEYTVVFTDEDDNELSATLTITDVLPVLTVDKDSIIIDKDSTIDDVLSQLELSATEITEGDLTEVISYDDSAVDYATAGEYTVVFTVADKEGNTDTANVTVTVSVTIEKSTLDGNTTASTTEETVLTDEELIALFEVTNSDDLSITVDQSAVDYSTPGEYTVVFTDEDDNVFNATLTIMDVLPVLSIDKDSITIGKDSTIDDVLSQLELSATEITEGDLTEVISYDDSAVDYATAGEYTVVFTVADEEGNEVSKTITVTILKENTNIEIDIDGSEVDNTVDVTDGDDITSNQTDTKEEDANTEENSDSEFTDVEDDNTKMTIATTGTETTILIMIISIVLAGLVYVKTKVSFKK